MKKLLLAGLIGSLLIGCGGGDDSTPTPKPDIPLIPLEPSKPIPPPAAEGGDQPEMGVTPDYDAPILDPDNTPEMGYKPSIEEKIADSLNWDLGEILELCGDSYVVCSVDKDQPTFTVTVGNSQSIYKPLDQVATVTGVELLESKLNNSHFEIDPVWTVVGTYQLHNIVGGAYVGYQSKMSAKEWEMPALSGHLLPTHVAVKEVSSLGSENVLFIKPAINYAEKRTTLLKIMLESALVND